MIRFSCRQCGKAVRVGEASAGKQGRCPFCKSVMVIPLSSAAESPADALAALAAEPSADEQAPPPPPSSLDDVTDDTGLELDLGADPNDRTDVLEALEEKPPPSTR